MAIFKFKYGVMTAGKSQELLRTHYNYKNKGEEVLVIVPSYERKDGIGIVQSRAGGLLSANSVMPGELKTWLKNHFEEERDYACVLLDETQFFTKEDIFALKEKVVIKNNIEVIAYGLKTDFQNSLFEGSQTAFIVAEEINEIETICAFCNNKAIMNIRFNEGKPVKEGAQILIGQDEYRPVCHKHFIDDTVRINQGGSSE